MKQPFRLVFIALAAGLGAASCEASLPCVYTGRLFHADVSCLDAYAPIGVVQAEQLDATCAAVCLQQGEALYVSTVCPPYPETARALDASLSVECADALALLDTEDSTCE